MAEELVGGLAAQKFADILPPVSGRASVRACFGRVLFF